MKPLKPIQNKENIKVGTVKEAQTRYRFGRVALLNAAEKCGAVIRIGRMVRLNFSKLDKYFDDFKEDK